MNDSDRTGTQLSATLPMPMPMPMPNLRGSFPGPFPTSPYADDIERHTADWLQAFPLISSPGKLKALCNITGQGMARTFPTSDRDSLFLCADLLLWLTAFDDTYGESTGARDPARLIRRISECVHLLADHDEPPGETSVFGTALRHLLTRFGERATPNQYLRLTAHLRDSLFGILWEAHHLDKPDHVTLADYLAMRPHTAFVRTVMATAEITLGYELAEPQRSSAAVREMEAAVADLAGWINDLASYAKETSHDGQSPLSLPTLLMRQHACDLEEAFRLASRMCEERADAAVLRITALTANGNGPLADHARAIKSIASSYVWHIQHSRYRDHE
ncbi:terpene synthase family protein [Streptomyces sp. NPDC056835]|uniref:terpene synthase family protein n=1 Tax=Streptomyces sp. NPDC056835 TaxID=3345956 RepID=UPI00368D6E4C